MDSEMLHVVQALLLTILFALVDVLALLSLWWLVRRYEAKQEAKQEEPVETHPALPRLDLEWIKQVTKEL